LSPSLKSVASIIGTSAPRKQRLDVVVPVRATADRRTVIRLIAGALTLFLGPSWECLST